MTLSLRRLESVLHLLLGLQCIAGARSCAEEAPLALALDSTLGFDRRLGELYYI